MEILTAPTTLKEIREKEEQDEVFFEDMVKCVADLSRNLLAVSAELHADLEQLLLEAGSDQKDLYGFNILYDDGEIEYDSLINPPRNREAGYPRAGRDVADPKARQRIREIVEQWIEG